MQCWELNFVKVIRAFYHLEQHPWSGSHFYKPLPWDINSSGDHGNGNTTTITWDVWLQISNLFCFTHSEDVSRQCGVGDLTGQEQKGLQPTTIKCLRPLQFKQPVRNSTLPTTA